MRVTMTPVVAHVQVAVKQGVTYVPAPTCAPTTALIWLAVSKEQASPELGAARAGTAAARVKKTAISAPAVLWHMMWTSFTDWRPNGGSVSFRRGGKASDYFARVPDARSGKAVDEVPRRQDDGDRRMKS